MIKFIDICDQNITNEVWNLQRISYLVEAEYIGTMDIPPLKESLMELMNCGETFIGAYIDGQLAGVLSYKIEGDKVDIHRVMVHPSYFRRGIGKELICFLEIMHLSAKEIIVSTGAKNTPAVNLYLKLGFEKKDERVYGDVRVANFHKHIKRDSE